MSFEQQTDSVPQAVDTPVQAETEAPVEPGTTETVAEVETDEQKNERLLRERQERSERAKSGIQKRFSELTSRANDAERRAEMALKLVERLTGQQGQPQAKPEGPPQRDDPRFQSYDEYLDARADYIAEQRAREIVEAQTRQFTERQQQEQAQRVAGEAQRAFRERVTEFAKATPDYDSVVDRDDVEVPDSVVALMYLDENPGALLYAFGKNPGLLRQFEGRSPVEQAVMLGRISESLKAKAPQVSNAPVPGKPVAARSTQISTDPTDTDSPEEWLRKRNAQLRRG